MSLAIKVSIDEQIEGLRGHAQTIFSEAARCRQQLTDQTIKQVAVIEAAAQTLERLKSLVELSQVVWASDFEPRISDEVLEELRQKKAGVDYEV